MLSVGRRVSGPASKEPIARLGGNQLLGETTAPEIEAVEAWGLTAKLLADPED